ncbi:hypothetical protein BT63DRAFT_458818 [Microthyrium microscopicum]|uniref:LysM domain-containing protein n=1 Tax=Microthyrium microscopicum TaxID=703497 RepID=A0A6A6U3G8_9PEZI|nr:hypothetical protein BT63DRAFT_458818 [Microthyrium microscopicum]
MIGIDKCYYDCDDLSEEHNVTAADALKWNPWAGTDCNNGIYDGLSTTDGDSYNAVCVRLGNSTWSNTTVSGSQTTNTASTTAI